MFLIPIPVILLWNTKINLFLLGIGLFCAKYQDDVKDFFDRNFTGMEKLKEKFEQKFA